jgi:ribonuclease E
MAVEPESSYMVEGPIDEEPPIAETEAVEEAKPKRRRGKKTVAEAEIAVLEPAPAEAPPTETAEQAAEPAKPTRKRRSKAKEQAEAVEGPSEVASVPAANNDTAEESTNEPRRSGWWQRTFG